MRKKSLALRQKHTTKPVYHQSYL